MNQNLLSSINKIHTTKLGIERIEKNLNIDVPNVVDWCVRKIRIANKIVRKGKNWYVYFENYVITINAHSFTIITAHLIP